MASDLVLAAVALMQSTPELEAFRALRIAFSESNGLGGVATLNGALSAILTAAGITPATLGPDMIDRTRFDSETFREQLDRKWSTLPEHWKQHWIEKGYKPK